MNWTGCSLSSTWLLGSHQMPADTIIWHNFWRTYTGCGCHNVSTISCVCWCTTAWTEQRRVTCLTWQRLSAVPHVVSSVERQPLISWYHKPVAHQLSTVRLPWQVHERGTVSFQLSTYLQIVPYPKKLKSFVLGLSFCSWQHVGLQVQCKLWLRSALY